MTNTSALAPKRSLKIIESKSPSNFQVLRLNPGSNTEFGSITVFDATNQTNMSNSIKATRRNSNRNNKIEYQIDNNSDLSAAFSFNNTINSKNPSGHSYGSNNFGSSYANRSNTMNSILNWNEESNSGWTGTGVMSDRSSVYSIDDGDFDREASRKVNNQLREIESILYEQNLPHKSNSITECNEWLEKFPHIRVLGTQLLSSRSDGESTLENLRTSLQSLRMLTSKLKIFFLHNYITGQVAVFSKYEKPFLYDLMKNL